MTMSDIILGHGRVCFLASDKKSIINYTDLVHVQQNIIADVSPFSNSHQLVTFDFELNEQIQALLHMGVGFGFSCVCLVLESYERQSCKPLKIPTRLIKFVQLANVCGLLVPTAETWRSPYKRFEVIKSRYVEPRLGEHLTSTEIENQALVRAYQIQEERRYEQVLDLKNWSRQLST